jgi:hypothetical protein
MRLKDAYIAATAALIFAAPPLYADPEPSARSLFDVKTIRVDTAVCPAMIKNELSSRGFDVSFDGPADAVLDVAVTNDAATGSDGSQRPAYSATLRGQNEQVLFMAAGDKQASTARQFCAGIADDIADQLRKQEELARLG